ncbi:MAG: PGN_0703 family putative restriction endonuclease [Candidatus Acidiferrales bacterium]
MSYQNDLKQHLTEYKKLWLGISEPGVFRHRGRDLLYGHILPVQNAELNLFEEARHFRQIYTNVKLHRYFHHLNSSQAFAINLFFPFFSGKPEAASALLRALGSPGVFASWEPEWVPDPIERTNIDVSWRTESGATTVCEVKLSETDFGKTLDDSRHREKFPAYRDRLIPHLEATRLERVAFFDAYQFNRNVYHMVLNDGTRLLFLLPRANTVLWERLKELLNGVMPSTRARISAVAIETAIAALCTDEKCPKEMREYAARLKQKYVIPNGAERS